jgi:hypothetical protein
MLRLGLILVCPVERAVRLHDDEVLDSGQIIAQLLDQGEEVLVKAQDASFGVIEDVFDFVVSKSDVDWVEDCADLRRGVVCFKQLVGVIGNERYHVALTHTQPKQRIRQAVDARIIFGVGEALVTVYYANF